MPNALTRARRAYEARQQESGGMKILVRLNPVQAMRVRRFMTTEGISAAEAIRRLLDQV